MLRPARVQLLSKEFPDWRRRQRAVQRYYNAGIPIGKRASFYSFGGWTHRDNQSTGFYRRANVSNTVLDFYPDGFLPEINTEVADVSLVGGIDFTSGSGWNLDLSMSHGRNSFDFLITNSNTPPTASPARARRTPAARGLTRLHSTSMFRRQSRATAGPPTSHSEPSSVETGTESGPGSRSRI